ncbi:MAG: alpha-D-ribose 1-methylphosphonate 5-triphosphate diphosphatase, partial [Pseudomonadota bacterium]
GIVDAHGDGFERHLAPRRGAAADLNAGLVSLDRELAANGITTAMLAQFWSWEGGMRGPDFARALAEALRHADIVGDMRVLLRVEIGCFADFPDIERFVGRFDIGHVVLSDHLPHRALAAGTRVPRLEGQALKAGRAPSEHQALLERLHRGLADAWTELPGLVSRLAHSGVRVGSHDDPDPDTRATFRAMGATVAEFPTTLATAKAAHGAGDVVVMGAPNVVRGGSHVRGGTAAAGMLADGLVTALASDYHYPALVGAVRRLVSEGWPLAKAWTLVSSGPARALGFTDRGCIATGLRGDMVVADPGLTRIHGTFVAGRPVYADAVLAERLIAAAA